MAPKHHSLLPLFSLIFLFLYHIIIILPCSCANNNNNNNNNNNPQEEEGYEGWLKWNVQNHRSKRPRATNAAVLGGNRSRTLDVMLENAENNKVRLFVKQDGTGDYRTITEAIDDVPKHNTRRIILVISPGVYREKIEIPKNKPFITFMGDPNKPPTITGNDSASVTRGDGTPLHTFRTPTVAVDSDYFVALNIIFQNTATHEVGSAQEQAVGLRISGNKAAFYECSFYGSQDTLYDHRGLHYFRNCFIQGSVDFIFGYARSLYENCTLNSIAKKAASITAQKRTERTMSSGFSFKDCKVTGSGRVYLGRAWGDHSRVVYSFSFLDKNIAPLGWNNWGKSNRDSTVYYGEYKCFGPGSNRTGRVSWARALTDEEAEPFIGSYYVEGDTWLISPST